MEPNWSHQGFYSYYHDTNRPSNDRQNTSPNNETGAPQPEDHVHRRAQTQPGGAGGAFLPPPPHQSPHHNMNLPPFSQTFYSPYHGSAGGGHQPSASTPATLPMGYGNNQPMSAPPGGGYPSYLTSPANMAGSNIGRQPPPHSYNESPRIAAPGWASSPAGFRHLSPTSPTTHLIPPGALMASSASTSSSSHPSVTRTPSMLPKAKRRSGSPSHSAESWEEGDRGMGVELGEETEDRPWGMPQDDYKKLNPRDKKQVRNRIGARRFRAKRKDYVSNLEGSLRAREDEIVNLRGQVSSQRAEINNLRARLGMPQLQSPPTVADGPGSGLGLLVNHSDGWDEKD